MSKPLYSELWPCTPVERVWLQLPKVRKSFLCYIGRGVVSQWVVPKDTHLLLTQWVPNMMWTMSGGLGGLRWLEDLRSSSCLLGVKYERCWRATLAETYRGGGCAHDTRKVDRYALGACQA